VRERQRAGALQDVFDRRGIVADDQRPARTLKARDPQRAAVVEHQPRTLAQAALTPDQREPRARRIVDRPHHQQFDRAAGRLARE
jgi:hypothetical protein